MCGINIDLNQSYLLKTECLREENPKLQPRRNQNYEFQEIII